MISAAYLDLTLPDLAANLALDEALLQAAEEGEGPPVLRTWESAGFGVVLGASCRLGDEVHVDACRADGVRIGRRSSGGGTVVIGPGALNAAVVLPVEAAPELRAVDTAQRFVLERTAGALRDLGAPVEVLGSGDLTLNTRKFAGSAQRRLRRFVLVHTTILYGFPLGAVTRYLAAPPRQPAYREGRSHADFLVNLDLPRDRILDALWAAWVGPGEASREAPVPAGRLRDLVASRFADPAWIERL